MITNVDNANPKYMYTAFTSLLSSCIILFEKPNTDGPFMNLLNQFNAYIQRMNIFYKFDFENLDIDKLNGYQQSLLDIRTQMLQQIYDHNTLTKDDVMKFIEIVLVVVQNTLDSHVTNDVDFIDNFYKYVVHTKTYFDEIEITQQPILQIDPQTIAQFKSFYHQFMINFNMLYNTILYYTNYHELNQIEEGITYLKSFFDNNANIFPNYLGGKRDRKQNKRNATKPTKSKSSLTRKKTIRKKRNTQIPNKVNNIKKKKVQQRKDILRENRKPKMKKKTHTKKEKKKKKTKTKGSVKKIKKTDP